MNQHGAIGMRCQHRQHPLSLAQRIGEKNAGPIRMCRPPLPDLLPHPLHRRPAVTGQGEGCLGDQRIAGNDFKGRAGRVRVALVITGYYPHPSIIMGQPNLGAAQHMPGGMQAQGDRTKTRE